MKARPIIMSADSINAIRDGRKTQTRRVVKPQPAFLQVYEHKGAVLYDASHRSWCWNGKVHGRYPDEYLPSLAACCPYGQPGDLLWVRETWRPETEADTGYAFIRYRAGGEPTDAGTREQVVALMDGTDRWRPSIYMPRRASRLTLRLADVRVQRVQDISEEDARAEGVIYSANPGVPNHGNGYIPQFHTLWDSINAKRGHDWDSNPWVWALTFEPIWQNVDEVAA